MNDYSRRLMSAMKDMVWPEDLRSSSKTRIVEEVCIGQESALRIICLAPEDGQDERLTCCEARTAEKALGLSALAQQSRWSYDKHTGQVGCR